MRYQTLPSAFRLRTDPLGPKLPPLKTLEAALTLQGPRGMCLHRAAALVFDVPGSNLIFATFDPDPSLSTGDPLESAVPFIHAWVEFKGFVFAPSSLDRTGGVLIAQDRAGYYAINRASDFRMLTRPALLRLDRQLGLKRHLTKAVRLKGDVSFGGALLDAANVPWSICPTQGGLIPAHQKETAE